MKKIFAILLTLWSCQAAALTQAQLPAKFPLAWGANAGAAYIRSIPQSSQIGIQNCAASLNDGFPPLTFVPSVAGGCPPFGQDMNGILKQVTQWSQWQGAAGPVYYDGTFATNVGGYPKGTILQSTVLAGRLWLSTADSNSTNPDATDGTAANWIVPPGSFGAGTPIAALSTTLPSGQVAANGTTVGNASSNATGRANADTYWVFSFLWSNCASCTLFNSGGTVVAKGASASVDFAAGRAIATINMNGSGLIGADRSGSALLTGVPVISGSTTVPGSFIGENLHVLVATQIPAITGPLSVSFSTNPSQIVLASGGGISTTGASDFNNINVTVVAPGNLSVLSTVTPTSTGSFASTNTGAAGNGANPAAGHNDVQRSVVTFWNLSL